jgi:hypothetical protein
MGPDDQKLLLHMAQKSQDASPEPFCLPIPSRVFWKFQLGPGEAHSEYPS